MAEPTRRRVLVSHLKPRAIAEPTQVLLARVGYTIVSVEDWENLQHENPDAGDPLDLRLVDDRCWGEVPGPKEAPESIVVLTGRNGTAGEDPRVVGAILRPAGLHDLFRLLQNVLEDTPRSTPRVPTHLRARCESDGKAWQASVLSLSENGCLLRSPERLRLGSRLRLAFSLPNVGEVETEADVAYQMLPDLGLVFNATPSISREAILDFVYNALGGDVIPRVSTR